MFIMADEITETSPSIRKRRESANSASSDPKTYADVEQGINEVDVTNDNANDSDLNEPSAEVIEEEAVEEESVEERIPPAIKEPSSIKIAKHKPKSRAKQTLEYDLKDMYPEMNLLAESTKKYWNYHDPEVIRAIWLEAKTNALTEWKYKHTKIPRKKKKPDIEVQTNHTMQLRKEFIEHKKEREKELEQRNLMMTDTGRDAPDFQELKLPTTMTAEMRYKFNRDNPPVPKFYLHHFERYKKPPFKTKVSTGNGCKPSNTMP